MIRFLKSICTPPGQEERHAKEDLQDALRPPTIKRFNPDFRMEFYPLDQRIVMEDSPLEKSVKQFGSDGFAYAVMGGSILGILFLVAWNHFPM